MSNQTKATPAPAADTPKPAAPAFHASKATPVPPKRHEGTARTVGHIQADGDKTHLFSYAGDYIATVSAAEGKGFLPAPPEKTPPATAPSA